MVGFLRRMVRIFSSRIQGKLPTWIQLQASSVFMDPWENFRVSSSMSHGKYHIIHSIFNLTLPFFLSAVSFPNAAVSECQFFLTCLFLFWFVLGQFCCLQQYSKSIFAINFLRSNCSLVRSPFRVSFCHTVGNQIPLWDIFKCLGISYNPYLNIWS